MPGDAGSRARKNNNYWRLTHVENGLPFIFAALYICAAIYSFLRSIRRSSHDRRCVYVGERARVRDA